MLQPATSRDINPATAPPSTEADQAQTPVASGTIDVPFMVPPFPKAPQVVLYDQYDNASVIGTLSATFTDFPTFNADLADDFVVPAGQTWNVQSIDADGVYLGPGPANSFNVFFYADNGGLPGAQVYSAMNQPFSVAGSTFTVALPSDGSPDRRDILGRDPGQHDVSSQRRVALEGSHCAIESGRSLAKSRRRLWCVPDMDAEDNLHPHYRRAGSGIPA